MRGDGLHAYLMLCILILDSLKYLLHLDEGIRHDFLHVWNCSLLHQWSSYSLLFQHPHDPVVVPTLTNDILFVIQSEVEKVMRNPDWSSSEWPDVTEGHSTSVPVHQIESPRNFPQC